ncbi:MULTISPECIES: polysaccharide pyruvyl transferase family protein [unclassified Arcicella]|uniref:polysaccharide pyruvyl transferase family protein n=1 Tax=unclassified Arcicella TaxID=2644986 RepID=UPI00285C10D8|nr:MULTISPECIES: polysaccharide pyruvyl transferase family protein [unclassified Arcicella]MDR6562122.1 polysaccharide pyruvyl transferase WcaK-like protein [Arcicella sp. BE51]MDR6812183.1 polysaccharide pyruvyl transferase WcaK-like protein [Arcicella sp. BE140]MDR6823495.1 polysaccharide pyruvyl transferase WcaK-like protein [Arcicella sp. BE139]
MKRRKFIEQAGLFSTGLFFTSFISEVIKKTNPTILLVSGWQDVNIGDIGHTPGLLHILETFIPKATIILWKKSNSEEVKKLLNKNFPKVKIIYGGVNKDKDVDNPEILEAFQKTDLMIHGSGPLLVGADNLASWMKYTTKPFGIFGTTLENPSQYHQSILQKASFIYTRETKSIEHLKKVSITGNHVQFAPDATFYINIHNDKKGFTFLKENGLEAKKFICAVPRLRYTPYHKFNPNNNGWSAEKVKEVESINEKYKEIDHAKLREAMIAWVRETGNKVLVCPEMTYAVELMDELLINPLPDDVKPFIVKRGYWLPDEAASVYSKAHSVLSLECHSPIIAAANGTPFFYLRQPEDTIKGQMYYDLDFNDWVFEIDNTTGKQIADRLREVWKDYDKAKIKLKSSMDKVESIYKSRTDVLKTILNEKYK